MGIRKKLKSRRGESLAETLIAVMIGALAITMFTGMVVYSIHIISTNRSAMARYYARNNLLVEGRTDEAVPGVTSEDGHIVLQGILSKSTSASPSAPDPTAPEIPVTYYTNTTNSRQVIAYQKKTS